MTEMIPLGARTRWGIVTAVAWLGERYYFFVDKYGVISMLPACVVEEELNEEQHSS